MLVRSYFKINRFHLPRLSCLAFQHSLPRKTNAFSHQSFDTSASMNSEKRSPPRYPTGYDLLLDRRINKGTAFTIEERQLYRIHGLLPPTISTPQLQVERFIENLRNMPDDLS
ncbi:unnamed protein product, partial [Adineta steineri]